jgi:hypothetical protein
LGFSASGLLEKGGECVVEYEKGDMELQMEVDFLPNWLSELVSWCHGQMNAEPQGRREGNPN